MTAAAPARASARIGARSEALAGYALVAIPMVFFLVLQIGSLFLAAFISVWDWNIRSGPLSLEGASNYARMLNDPIFHKAVANSVYYALVWVPLTMAVGLFLAVIVNQRIRGQTFFRAAFYFPAIASSAAITTVWLFIVANDGLFNDLRGALGFNPFFQFLGYGPNHDWIGDYRTALNTIIVLNVWTTSGTFMLFYLASLQSISNEVYEAAAIDGATAWKAFRYITFPLLKPGHFFVATVGLIGALQLFDQSYLAGGAAGAPANALMTIVLYLYNALFVQINPGYAAAVGIVLFLIILGGTLIQRRLFGGTPAW